MNYRFLLLSILYTLCSIGIAVIPSIDLLTKSTLCISLGISALVLSKAYYNYKRYFKNGR